MTSVLLCEQAKSVSGFTAKWYDKTSGAFNKDKTGGQQCATAMALALGVAPSPELSTKFLVESISKANNHSLTGEIGWPYMVRATAAHAVPTLLAMLHRTDSPSYLYQYEMGATTLTEEWNAVWAFSSAAWCCCCWLLATCCLLPSLCCVFQCCYSRTTSI